ncbi:hypothetical protein [Mycolicibacterium parafortuitum]
MLDQFRGGLGLDGPAVNLGVNHVVHSPPSEGASTLIHARAVDFAA